MLESPVDDSLIVFIGTSGINWITEDCGATVSALNTGRKVQEWLFHPSERNYALAASWTSCEEFGDEPCRIYKELYYTHDLGLTFNFVADYVFDFEWGISQKVIENGGTMPKERVFVTKDPNGKGHQN